MRGHDERRRQLLADLSGRVVGIGAGTGLTFTHYPPTVSEVIAVEPDPRRRAVATRNARSVRVPIVVVGAVAEELPLGDGTMDAAVASLVLCSVSDLVGALAELRRVLRPWGELRFLEHIIAERGPLRALQRLLAPVYARVPDGCRIDRDTVTGITEAGFAIEACERFMHADGALEPAIPHVLGTAHSVAHDGLSPLPGRPGGAAERAAACSGQRPGQRASCSPTMNGRTA